MGLVPRFLNNVTNELSLRAQRGNLMNILDIRRLPRRSAPRNDEH